MSRKGETPTQGCGSACWGQHVKRGRGTLGTERKVILGADATQLSLHNRRLDRTEVTLKELSVS